MAILTTMPEALLLQLAATTDGLATPIASLAVMLMSDAHDFDAAAAASFVAAVVADEVGPTNYARQPLAFAGGVTIDTDGRAQITWTDTAFGLLGGALDATIGGCYVYDDTGDDATSRLLYSSPFETAETTDGTAVTVRWGAPTARVAP